MALGRAGCLPPAYSTVTDFATVRGVCLRPGFALNMLRC
jgi:hypothetical protein